MCYSLCIGQDNYVLSVWKLTFENCETPTNRIYTKTGRYLLLYHNYDMATLTLLGPSPQHKHILEDCLHYKDEYYIRIGNSKIKTIAHAQQGIQTTTTYLLDVVDPCEHAHAPIVDQAQLLS